ncbi:MAG: geranylgeranyl reductase family protein [Nitrospiria bacterium]
MYDVAVVGGGLSGCFAAFHLAQGGLKVLVIEEHQVSGEPRYCTGIIGKEAFDRFNLPTLPVQNSFSSATLFSPFGTSVRISKPEPQAYIVNRAKFDQQLSQNALYAGAQFRYSTRCVRFETLHDRIKLTLQTGKTRENVESRVAILSTGTYYGLHSQMKILRPKQFLDTAQVEIDASGISEVEVYFGNKVAPGSFAWATPLTPGRARIGVSTYKNASLFLNRFLASPYFLGRIPDQRLEIKRKVIPVSNLKRTYGHRYLVIGDAAGQVKPTTGGGIYYALLSARLASHNILKAFEQDLFLESHFKRYQDEWQDKIGSELRIGSITRKILGYLSDSQIDSLVKLLQKKEISSLIEKHANFDWHQPIILALSKNPLLLLHISKRIFSRKKEVLAVPNLS